MDMLVIVIVVFVVLLFAGLYWLFSFKQKTQVVETILPVDPLEQLKIDVLYVNMKIRKKCKNEEIINLSEEILDTILNIFPKLKEMNTFGNSTATIKFMPKRYLLDKCITPFTGLSDATAEHVSATIDSLNILKGEVAEIKTYVENDDLKSLEEKSAFIQKKFK
jgi:hypothetical protein